jgi:hypothetical protein
MPVNIDHSTAGSTTLAAPSSGTATVTLPSATGTLVYADTNNNATISGTYVMGSSFLRNRLINGNMYIAQRATSATVTAGTAVPTASTGYPCVDRWFVYSTGANVTAAQVAGSGSNLNLLQVTGAASVTAIGIGQRIEQLNSIDLAGQTCTLSVNIANSVLTTVTWTASYATTADTFGTIGTPTKTQIATGTFTVSSTLTQYTTSIAIPSAATTGIEILFTVGAQTSGTWQIGNAQLEAGTIATPFERRLYGEEFLLCQRYFEKSWDISTAVGTNTAVGNISCVYMSYYGACNGFRFQVPKRIVPTVVGYYNGTSGQWSFYTGPYNGLPVFGDLGTKGMRYIQITGWTTPGLNAGGSTGAEGQYTASAEL